MMKERKLNSDGVLMCFFLLGEENRRQKISLSSHFDIFIEFYFKLLDLVANYTQKH